MNNLLDEAFLRGLKQAPKTGFPPEYIVTRESVGSRLY